MTREHSRLSEQEDSLRESCEALLGQVPDLVHLSLIMDGEHRFSVDRENSAEIRARLAAEAAVHAFLQIHEALQVARTGALIRLLLHTSRGALLAYTVPGRGHLIGFSFGTRRAEIDEADRALSDLASTARELAMLTLQNPGGWLTPSPDEPIEPPRTEPVITGIVDERVLEACEASVNEVLQYVLYLGTGGRVFAVDHFDLFEPTTDGSTSPGRRRRVYRSLADDLQTDLRELRRRVSPVLGRAAHTAVLDVEHGAVLVRWLPGERQLMGVTVHQEQVHTAERMFAELGDRLVGLS
ncbi:hypothetical protein [Rugosimonospora africana]|uniref:Uncharacterized protein n=1 Tax=Rugosimonospora africana TaxID=556532 RepID=A0A8J3QSS6_9ACTN|nr:hypothetical protein [Rugosimonospora africana]GIH15080.1 hypothetical protein Raf01_32520 [Rugosimonospora africana]